MDPILQVDRLSISFTQYGRGLRRRTLPVIRDLSLSLLPGQVTAVVGASGSGKSLLAHAILGLLPYNSRTEGTILYRGEPLTRRRAEALRGREIVLIPQGVTYLDPLRKVGPQVRRGRQDAAARAESCIRRANGAAAPPTSAASSLSGSSGRALSTRCSTAGTCSPATCGMTTSTAGTSGRITTWRIPLPGTSTGRSAGRYGPTAGKSGASVCRTSV